VPQVLVSIKAGRIEEREEDSERKKDAADVCGK
jgi:hypothetical protein